MIKTAHIGNFKIAYRNETAFWQTYQEIFKDNEYTLTCHQSNPLILDCGSHIGLSVLYFKSIYPDSRIIAFEPDPQNFDLLRRNIAANKLHDVTAINAAVASYTGSTPYYRQIINDEDTPDTRGYSINQNWGDRGHSQIITVETQQLSSYIQEPVSFLKLDVEGVEQAVLQEIESRLGNIQQICMEYHGTRLDSSTNDLHTIVELLQRHFSEVTVTTKELQAFLPNVFDDWVKKTNPVLSKICATQSR